MPGVTTGDQVRKEDLDPGLLVLADMRNQTLVPRLRKGKKIMNSPFGWGVRKRGERRTAPVPEGMDVYGFESGTGKKLYNRKMKIWRNPMITTEAEEMTAAVGDALNDYESEKADKIIEQGRDLETVLLSDRDAQEDTGVKDQGEGTMGLGRIINDGVSVGAAGVALTFGDQQTAIPQDYRTPASSIYVGALASFSEATLNDLLRNRFDQLGGSPELSLFLGSLLKAKIADFGRYQADKNGYTAIIRITDKKSTTLTKGIDVFEGDNGTIDVNPTCSWMPYTSRGYILAMEDVFLRTVLWLRHQMLEDKGAGRRGLIQTIFGLQYGSPLKHAKIDPAS